MARSAKQLAMCKLKKQAIDVVPRPKDCKVIRSGWANCLKRGQGETLKYKARVIMQVFTQLEGGLDGPFMPVGKSSYPHEALVLAAQSNLEAHKVNVSSTLERFSTSTTQLIGVAPVAHQTSHQTGVDIRAHRRALITITYFLLGIHPNLSHTITAFNRCANTGIKHARHSTACFAPAGHKRPTNHPSTGHYWQPNPVGPCGC